MMDKVHKRDFFKCDTPSSERFRIDLSLLALYALWRLVQWQLYFCLKPMWKRLDYVLITPPDWKKLQAFEEKLCDVSSSHGGEYEWISTV
jgi:hypothetical protein